MIFGYLGVVDAFHIWARPHEEPLPASKALGVTYDQSLREVYCRAAAYIIDSIYGYNLYLLCHTTPTSRRASCPSSLAPSPPAVPATPAAIAACLPSWCPNWTLPAPSILDNSGDTFQGVPVVMPREDLATCVIAGVLPVFGLKIGTIERIITAEMLHPAHAKFHEVYTGQDTKPSTSQTISALDDLLAAWDQLLGCQLLPATSPEFEESRLTIDALRQALTDDPTTPGQTPHQLPSPLSSRDHLLAAALTPSGLTTLLATYNLAVLDTARIGLVPSLSAPGDIIYADRLSDAPDASGKDLIIVQPFTKPPPVPEAVDAVLSRMSRWWHPMFHYRIPYVYQSRSDARYRPKAKEDEEAARERFERRDVVHCTMVGLIPSSKAMFTDFGERYKEGRDGLARDAMAIH